MTQTFVVSGTSFTIPADWNNANNKIEGIGGGQNGDGGTGRGGKGAYYCKITNESHAGGAVISIQIGAAANPGTDTKWQASPTLLAPGGLSVSAAVGTVQNSGGTGSLGNGCCAGGGAGGAGGPDGAGANAANPSTSTGGKGGGGDAGLDGAGGNGGGANVNGSAGVAGTVFDSTHGSGGGGGGGGGTNNPCIPPATTGGKGGKYGGGGGQRGGGGGTQGLGEAGLLVITNTAASSVFIFTPAVI